VPERHAGRAGRADLHELHRDVAGAFVVPQPIEVQPVDLADKCTLVFSCCLPQGS